MAGGGDGGNAVGIDSKERQGLIRLARNNGKQLGFMA